MTRPQKINLTQPVSEADFAAAAAEADYTEADRQFDLQRCTICGDTAGWCTNWNNHAPEPYRRSPWPPVREEPDESYWDEPEGWDP